MILKDGYIECEYCGYKEKATKETANRAKYNKDSNTLTVYCLDCDEESIIIQIDGGSICDSA